MTIIDDIKRLERAGNSASKSSQKLIDAATRFVQYQDKNDNFIGVRHEGCWLIPLEVLGRTWGSDITDDKLYGRFLDRTFGAGGHVKTVLVVCEPRDIDDARWIAKMVHEEVEGHIADWLEVMSKEDDEASSLLVEQISD